MPGFSSAKGNVVRKPGDKRLAQALDKDECHDGGQEEKDEGNDNGKDARCHAILPINPLDVIVEVDAEVVAALLCGSFASHGSSPPLRQ